MAEVVGCLFGESPEGGLSGVASTCLSLSCSPAASHCSSAGPEPNQKQTRSGTTCYMYMYILYYTYSVMCGLRICMVIRE